ncbi:Uma2 family endonuclease [Streptomyces sp. NPDC101227]|uniref:Uma2 family endonuclease n=1 Tax=Streptomyces sp. NPDC101227 TaxID=3366136 RepID=UPI003829FC07
MTTIAEAMLDRRLNEALWQAWTAMELPEGCRAEIIETGEGSGRIDVWRVGHYVHAKAANRMRNAMDAFLDGGGYAAYGCMNVIHGRRVWFPDGVIALEDGPAGVTDDGLGIKAAAVELIAEVVSPGRENMERDRVRKRRAYARAGIPVYVLIDDYDHQGTVSVLTAPCPDEAIYAVENRVRFGSDVTVPEGPAKGFTIGGSITGPPRTAR